MPAYSPTASVVLPYLKGNTMHLVIPCARSGTGVKETSCIFRADDITTNKNGAELLLLFVILICLSMHFCTNPCKSTRSLNCRKDLRVNFIALTYTHKSASEYSIICDQMQSHSHYKPETDTK